MTPRFLRLLACFACCAALTAYPQGRQRSPINDFMYPSAPAAKPFMDFDGAGFIIDGQPTFLSSGSIHYPRVPHELWEDRLLRLKQGSFAAVQTYLFWNFHEPQENKFDFKGDKDVETFLKTAQKLGLYAIARVGPYVCAEWDSGGYPVWLKFQPPFSVRQNNPDWLKWNDHWYDKIIPLVAKHQVNRGGNVVLIQLENEHPQGWGVVTNNPYFEHLRADAVKLGVEVPFFMSGLNHGSAPKPGNIDSTLRTNPWMTTEFWVGWYTNYGSLPERRNHEIEDTIWTIQAHGGGGYNFYMTHGGTDFDSWNNDEVGASYDDGAIIGQAGDLRPLYYRVKRANQLAQSFPEILAHGNDDPEARMSLLTEAGPQLLGYRKSRSGMGAFAFLENPNSTDQAGILSGDTILFPPRGVYPVPYDVLLADGVRVVHSSLPALARARFDKTTTFLVYGQPGQNGHLTLSSTNGAQPLAAPSGPAAFHAELTGSNQLNLKVEIPANGVGEYDFQSGAQFIRVLALNDALSLYTWIVGPPGKQYVVCGPAFVRSVQESRGKLTATIEQPFLSPACGQVAVFGDHGKTWHLSAGKGMVRDETPAPNLEGWKMFSSSEALPSFDDHRWRHSENPEQMGADGDISAFAWYRANVKLPAAGSGILHFQGADSLEVFVNGARVENSRSQATANLTAGVNTIAVFVSHHGRNKDYNYLGPLDTHDRKGLWGTVSLEMGGTNIPVTGWAMRGGVEQEQEAARKWTGLEEAHGAPAFYRTTFQDIPPKETGPHPILRVNYKGLTRGTMWINGHNLGRYPEKINIDSLYIPECWLKSGANELTVFDETGASPAKVELTIEAASSRNVIVASEPVDPMTRFVLP